MAASTFNLEQTTISSIRSLPPDTYLIHATNCIAEWGAGIAAELALVFPAAYTEYKRFCIAAKTEASAP
ncbi:ADP-ribose 1''-phosphate phosphatase [Ilyonectria robusta]